MAGRWGPCSPALYRYIERALGGAAGRFGSDERTLDWQDVAGRRMGTW